MIVAVQQPEHVPWLGFFDKMSMVDTLVLLDNVQFKKRYFENRNKIKTINGWQWVNVPVFTKNRYKQRINEVLIDDTQDWRRKYINSLIHSYSKSEYFKGYFGGVKKIIDSEWGKLVDLNIEFINFFRKSFGLSSVSLVKASSLGLERDTKGSQLILDICGLLGARVYISGPDGENYLEMDAFRDKSIEVRFHHYAYPVYRQAHGSFISHMSSLDFLFNCGGEAFNKAVTR